MIRKSKEKEGPEVSADHIQSDPAFQPILSFEEFPLPKEVIKKLLSAGFDQPTPIQSQAWPAALSGQCVLGIAPRGTGKTLAYLLPGIRHILHIKKRLRVSE